MSHIGNWTLLSAVLLTIPPQLRAGEAEPSIPVQSWEQVQKQVQESRGQVVVINLWTSTCGLCLEELPQFEKMAKEFRGQKVKFLTVNCDYDGIEGKPPEFYRPDVREVLKKENIRTPTVMLTISFLDFLEMLDLSSTPAILVYDAEGKLVHRFDNDDAIREEDEFTQEEVRLKIKELLAKDATRE